MRMTFTVERDVSTEPGVIGPTLYKHFYVYWVPVADARDLYIASHRSGRVFLIGGLPNYASKAFVEKL